jgi:glycosyltransferase involved in cell wall biosynthesis
MFSWPPHGGGCTDVKETMTRLAGMGHEVHLFVPDFKYAWQRGKVDESLLAFPVHKIPVSLFEFNAWTLSKKFKRAVDTLGPDVVFLGDSYFFKPYLMDAFRDYFLVARFYTYEIFCPQDYNLFRDGATCTTHYLRTPVTCMKCALDGMSPRIRSWQHDVWSHEFIAALAFRPGYHKFLRSSLEAVNTVIVYNELTKKLFSPYHQNVHIVPGGVASSAFEYSELPAKARDQVKHVLMVGRAGDTRKGLSTLVGAAKILESERDDFEVWVTHDDELINTGRVRAVGWRPHSEIKSLYAQADICVVPSLWEEPFGMVALEAMAVGRPVIASRVGGLASIVLDGETGFLVPPGDETTLADRIRTLLDDPRMRHEMGWKGRQRAETRFDWDAIVERHYPALLSAADGST